ncbi:MerR family transcriptional regulator [Streptomyces sp. NPDC018019]|uniref:helix-turn-helix domain-containing protein n=1 Tax=Streptomyces sp. NPDC018019 TaxID=3365030 RepID=UPI0037B2581A
MPSRDVDDELHSISEVARCFGLSVATLRYYDELGLLPPAGRRGNVRHYGRRELRRLALIQHLHHGGMLSLADTAAALGERGPDGVRRPPGRAVLTGALQLIEERMADLQAARQRLAHLLTCPTRDPVRECTLLRAELDRNVAQALGR